MSVEDISNKLDKTDITQNKVDEETHEPSKIEKLNKRELDQVNEIIICEAFQYYDKDGSGFLEREEIKQMISNAAKKMNCPSIADNEESLNRIIAHFDQDNDGRISFEEFKQVRDSMADQLIGEAFKNYDFEKTGYLTRDE